MKILVATSRTQGARYNDFHYCVEGELVWLPPPCGHGQNDPAGLCGCGRSFGGLSSHRATTTAQVADLDISAEDYLSALRASLAEQGWTGHLSDDQAEALLMEVRDGLTDIAAGYPVGTVVETGLNYVSARTTDSGGGIRPSGSNPDR